MEVKLQSMVEVEVVVATADGGTAQPPGGHQKLKYEPIAIGRSFAAATALVSNGKNHKAH